MTLIVHSDLTTQLKAGMTVTCQLGNFTDDNWSPAAPLLLLHTNVTFFGNAQFTGLYKKNENDWYLAQYVQTHHDRDNHVNQTGMDVGIAYCTSSVPLDDNHKACQHFNEHQNKILEHALFMHRAKVAELPVAERYIRDQPITA
jgi:hypothetical protein